jgi:hypothetical protein
MVGVLHVSLALRKSIESRTNLENTSSTVIKPASTLFKKQSDYSIINFTYLLRHTFWRQPAQSSGLGNTECQRNNTRLRRRIHYLHFPISLHSPQTFVCPIFYHLKKLTIGPLSLFTIP